MIATFQQAVQRVLGTDTQIRTQIVTNDPPDEEVGTRAQGVDGVVELSFSQAGERARLHCYVTGEKRWIDREISFGESRASTRSEINERGRLLGFAVATMYAGDVSEAEPVDTRSPTTPIVESSESVAHPNVNVPQMDGEPRVAPGRVAKHVAEFGAVVSSGLGGEASGVGATVGLRLALSGPAWARLFVEGRSGNIPKAQASTRTALMGGGLALDLLPEASSFEVGARLDAFAIYFDASHLSEDDAQPDRRSRWQGGADLVAEGGWRATQNAGTFIGAGIEGVLGETSIYTHHNRVAEVPVFRVVAELGFRTRF